MNTQRCRVLSVIVLLESLPRLLAYDNDAIALSKFLSNASAMFKQVSLQVRPELEGLIELARIQVLTESEMDRARFLGSVGDNALFDQYGMNVNTLTRFMNFTNEARRAKINQTAKVIDTVLELIAEIVIEM